MPWHVFFPCFGTKTVLFLERESCIRHGVTLVYTSSVRQAGYSLLGNKDVTIYCFFVVDNIYIEVDERYKDLKDAFVIGVSW